MVRGIVRHFHAGTDCPTAKRRNAREEKVNKHGNQWQRRLDGCSMETFQAGAGRATLFIQLVNCPMPPALPAFLLKYPTAELRQEYEEA